MSSRILASVLASMLFHGALAGGVLVLSGGKPVAGEKVYSVMLVDVLTLPAETVPAGLAPEAAVPTAVMQPVPEETKPEVVEEEPQPIAVRTQSERKPEPARKPELAEKPKPAAPQIRPDAQADASPATSGGAPQTAQTGPSIFIGGLAAYAEDAVDERPFITQRVLPEYPSRARRMNIRGRAEIRLVIDSSGMPKELQVYMAEPEGYFEEAALAAARATRFSPGKVGGRAVNTVVIIPFVFSLR